MSSITGFLSDAGLEPFQGRYPRLRLTPELPMTAGDRLIVRSPVEAAITDSTGAFIFAQIVASDETIPVTTYTLVAEWLSDPGQRLDVLTGLFIPTGDWNFSDLLVASGRFNTGTVMYGFGPPPETLTGVLYIDLSDGTLYGPSNGGI